MKILLIRLRSIGDIIQCTPAFAAARKMFGNASIDLMVEEKLAELVIENTSIDSLLLYKNHGRNFFEKLKYNFNFLKILRMRRYDVIIDFHGIPKTAWLSYLSGAGTRIGYNYAGRGHLYTHKIEPPEKFKVHSAVNQLNLLNAVPRELRHDRTVPNEAPSEAFMSAEYALNETESFLMKNAIDVSNSKDPEKILIYHITPSNNFKKWPASNYSALINMCERHPAFKNIKLCHIIIGRCEDEPAFEKIRSNVKPVKGRLVSACGKLSLGGVYNLAKKCVCYIGPDSGPMHIAAAAKANVIGLFGPTITETFGPLSKTFIGVCNKDAACRPCEQKRCATGNFRCITNINVSDVFYSLLKLASVNMQTETQHQ